MSKRQTLQCVSSREESTNQRRGTLLMRHCMKKSPTSAKYSTQSVSVLQSTTWSQGSKLPYRLQTHVSMAEEDGAFTTDSGSIFGRTGSTNVQRKVLGNIINYAGALTVIKNDGLGPDPSPVILALADYQSAVCWISRFFSANSSRCVFFQANCISGIPSWSK